MKEWAAEFYNSKAWRDTRLAFLLSKHYMCERCGDVATIVHHVIYLTQNNIDDPYIALGWNNFEALCQECHNKEHIKKKNKKYIFDESGNLLPPLSKKFSGEQTPRGGA